MIRLEKIAAQGDILVIRVDELPEGLKQSPAAGSYVVAHSETGAHHVARPKRGYSLERYEDPSNAMVSFLRIEAKGQEIKGKADDALKAIDAVLIEHERTFDTHETLALACEGEEAVYKVIRQRQAIPEGWAAVVD